MSAIKNDSGKPRYDLVPWDAMEMFVDVLNYGADKYAARNWEDGMEWSRFFAACLRHLTAWFQHREDVDPESGKSHLAHATCCLMFLMAYQSRGAGEDDRPNVEVTL